MNMFPSPTGVLYLLINFHYIVGAVLIVSVPYWGSLSSNNVTPIANSAVSNVSVPYWGSLSSNKGGAI